MVLSGLDRWTQEGPELASLRPGSRVGLLAHPASVDATADPAPLLFQRSKQVQLVRLFAPEHGLWGHEQDMESVPGSVDPWTGLQVVSLYGASPESLRPTPAALSGLDAVIVDLQDVGSRYYTYIYTMAHMMEAVRDAGIPLVVLDRPNPIGGLRVEGPLLHDELASFVGRYPIPVRHGMTLAELARWFNESRGIGCDLRHVPMRGWRRTMRFDETGLPWVPPSPNMPTPRTAQVYPGGCLVEGTNLSEGRGTTTPFELVGAPWLDALELARELAAARLPDARFRPCSFRPMFHKHAGQGCQGVQVIPCGDRFLPFETYLVLIGAARRQSPRLFAWRREVYEFESDRPAIDLLLGRADLRPAIEAGETLEALQGRWSAELERFSRERRSFLLYPD